MRALLLGGGLLATLAVATAREIPVEDFVREPAVLAVRLSPTGDYLGVLRTEEEEGVLYIVDLATGKSSRIRHQVAGYSTTVRGFEWIGRKRLLYSSGLDDFRMGSVAAVDVDGGRWSSLAGEDGLTFFFRPRSILRTQLDGDWVAFGQVQPGYDGALFPDLARGNHVTGETQILAKNPGDVIQWLLDEQMQPVAGAKLRDGEVTYALYKSGSRTWTDVGSPIRAQRGWELVGVTQEGKIAALVLNDQRRWAVGELDPATQKTRVLLSDEQYDMSSGSIQVDGMSFGGPLLSAGKKRILGVNYHRLKPFAQWIDSDLAKAQETINAALPGTANVIFQINEARNRMLVLSFSDRDPGTYYLYNADRQELLPLAKRKPWLDPSSLASTYPQEYTARDGLRIPCFITLPPGRTRKNLPLVVYVHGGPFAVKDTWGFNPMVQMLANRGYAVLQINFRGSSGYGIDHEEAGTKQIGRAMQDDITDGVKWAISAGLADASRIALMGESYGGYATLWGLSQTPDLYRCGIAVYAPVNWSGILREREWDRVPFAYDYLRKHVGDPRKERELLKVADLKDDLHKIKDPMLAVYSLRDPVVDIGQGSDLVNGLKRNKGIYEYVEIQKEGHSFYLEKSRLLYYSKVEAFLKKHMPADPIPTGKN